MLWFFSICWIILFSSVFLVLIFELIFIGFVVCSGKFIRVVSVSVLDYVVVIFILYFLVFLCFVYRSLREKCSLFVSDVKKKRLINWFLKCDVGFKSDILQQFKFVLFYVGGVYVDKDIEFVWFSNVFYLLILEFQCVDVDWEVNGLCFVWFEGDFFKVVQYFYWLVYGGGDVLQVELDYCCFFVIVGVGYLYVGGYVVIVWYGG